MFVLKSLSTACGAQFQTYRAEEMKSSATSLPCIMAQIHVKKIDISNASHSCSVDFGKL
jgi:hypothetical protein